MSPSDACSQDLQNNRVRRITLPAGTTSTISTEVIDPAGIAISPNGDFALVGVRAWPAPPASRHPADSALRTSLVMWCLPQHTHHATDCFRAQRVPPDVSQEYGGHRVRRVNLATGATTTLAGSRSAGFRDGVGASVLFSYPWGVAIDPTSTFALVAVRRPRISLHHAIPQTVHPFWHTDSTWPRFAHGV